MSERSNFAQGIRQMEANAAATMLSANEAEAYSMDAARAQEAIDARSNSPEVRRLNDMAQIEIWGTNGRTAGFVDPRDPNGKAPLTAPIKGTVNEIRDNRRYGTTAQERENTATAYEKDVTNLVNGQSKFELCQAKLIMDLRTVDTLASSRMLAKYVAGGMDAAKAADKVKDFYANKDYKRQEIIKKEGIFTPAEYVAKLTKTDSRSAPQPTRVHHNKAAELKKLNELTNKVNAVRDEYARRNAGRGRRLGFRNKEFDEESMIQARVDWEDAKDTRSALIHQEYKMARQAGVSKEDLAKYINLFAIGDNEATARSVYRQRLLATGSYKADLKTGNLIKVQPKTRLGRAAGKFYEWWGKQSNEKLLSTATLKKSAAMAAAGVVVGIPAAATGGLILGPIAGGALGAAAATKLAKGVMSYHVGKRSKGKQYVQELHEGLIRASQEGNPKKFAHALALQTEREVSANRRRVLVGLGAAAVGGGLSELGTHHLLGVGLDQHSGGDYIGGNTLTVESHLDADHLKLPMSHGVHGGHLDKGNYVGASSHQPVEQMNRLNFKGDTMWHEVSQQLHEQGIHANAHNIDEVTRAVLKDKGMTLEQARDLPVGFQFQIPPEAIEKLRAG